jgi:hypothetical protein
LSREELKRVELNIVAGSLTPGAFDEVLVWSRKEAKKRFADLEEFQGGLSSDEIFEFHESRSRAVMRAMVHISNSMLYHKAYQHIHRMKKNLINLFTKKINAELDTYSSAQQHALKNHLELWSSIGGTKKIFALFDCKEVEIPWERENCGRYLVARGDEISQHGARPGKGNILDWENLPGEFSTFYVCFHGKASF